MFTPLANYAGHEHVLNGVPCFVHPGNGNMYGVDIDKVGGVQQNLNVYRTRPGSTNKELVKRYIGGADSRAQIAAGGVVILQDGSMEVWASAVPLVGAVTRTGFSGVWDRVPNVDAPWSASAGGITLLASVATNPAWEARTLTAGEMVNIPAVFHVPSASAYLVRFTVTASAAGVRGRAGTEACPHFFTVNTQAPNVDAMAQGWAPGPACYVSPAQGQPTVYFQIVAYST